MEIRESTMATGKLVEPIGEIDMSTSGELREVLLRLVKQKTQLIVVSLQEAPYIDSSGLATLIEGFQSVQKYKGLFRLVITNPDILDVFKLARLDGVFQIYDSLASAQR